MNKFNDWQNELIKQVTFNQERKGKNMEMLGNLNMYIQKF